MRYVEGMSVPRTTENAWSPRKLLSLTACVLLLAAAVIVLPARSAESLLSGKGATEVSFQYVHTLIGEDSSGTCPRIEASEPEMGEVKNFLQDLNIRWHGFHGDVYDIDVPGYHLYFYNESSMLQADMYISSTGYLYCGHATYRIVSSSLEKVWTQLDSLYKLADNGESFS